MLHKAWNSKGEMRYRFPRSSVKFQGHTVQNITDFDPNWVSPDYRPVAAFKSLRFALFFMSMTLAILFLGRNIIYCLPLSSLCQTAHRHWKHVNGCRVSCGGVSSMLLVLSITFYCQYTIVYGSVCVQLAHSSLGDWKDISTAHVVIIIKSEVSAFPIVSIFFCSCVPEMFVTSYSVIYCTYIPGKPGFSFHYYCAVYDECKYSDTFWLADGIPLFVH